jgi:23S rRNA pseudouridine2605 synthase
MRLQKYLAHCGVAARRKCEEMIAAGRVAVNGTVITEMGTQVEAGDAVTVDGKPVSEETRKVYILYHKPIGEVSTASDPEGRPTVLDKFRDFPVRLYPVGRLDYDSEGLLLLTNDGELAQRMMHPRHEVDKTYLARVGGDVGMDTVQALRRGVAIDGRRTAPADVRVIRRTEVETVLLLAIHEGRNRQVRKMFEAEGYTVLMLRRVRFGPLQLGELARGEWRELTEAEIEAVKEL